MSKDGNRKTVARNKKARHQYHILETLEAGIVLQGSEVKSLREGNASLSDSYARVKDGEIWLLSMHIGPYGPAGPSAHEFKRPRKLLLRSREIRRLTGTVETSGTTLVPLEVYFRDGLAKVELALVRGKKLHDKREDIKRREADREVERALKRK